MIQSVHTFFGDTQYLQGHSYVADRMTEGSPNQTANEQITVDCCVSTPNLVKISPPWPELDSLPHLESSKL